MDPRMKSRFMSLYQMVLADGIIEAAEMEMLYRIGKENYGITEQQINELIKDSSFVSNMYQSLDEKVTLLYELGEIAWSDGTIDESERNLLKRYIINMGFEESNSAEIADFILDQVASKVGIVEVLNKIKS